MEQLKVDKRLLLIMGIPKQASIAESSGIRFCVFRDPALMALHSRIEYYQDDNCVVFVEWEEELALTIICSVLVLVYACAFL
jgi:hypothetical protein